MNLRKFIPWTLALVFTVVFLLMLARSTTPRMPGMTITGGPPMNTSAPQDSINQPQKPSNLTPPMPEMNQP